MSTEIDLSKLSPEMRYYYRHRQERLDYRKKYYNQNKEIILEKQKDPLELKKRADRKRTKYHTDPSIAEKDRQYQQNHPEINRKAAIKYRKERTAWLNQIKEESGCVQCGSKTNLIFHHLDKKSKEFQLAMASRRYDVLKKEMEKCIVLCRGCHSTLHNKERWDSKCRCV